MILNILGFVLLVVFTIAVHEIGHFLAARIYGVPVKRFVVGLGRPLLRHTSKRSGIEYALGWLPVGGYTKMADASDSTLTNRQRALAYDAQPVNHRALITLAGPGANLAVAMAIYWALTFIGTPNMTPVVAAPEIGTPAAMAGVRAGDIIIATDGTPTLGWNDVRLAVVQHIISAAPLHLTVRPSRHSQVQNPALNEAPRIVSLDLSKISTETSHPSALAGLTLSPEESTPITARIGFIPAFVLALNQTRLMTMMVVRSLDQYVLGRQQPAGPAARPTPPPDTLAVRSILSVILSLVAFININLGVVNLLPLPLLDGGQAVLLYGEAATGKRLPARARRAWSISGIAVILAVALAAIHGL